MPDCVGENGGGGHGAGALPPPCLGPAGRPTHRGPPVPPSPASVPAVSRLGKCLLKSPSWDFSVLRQMWSEAQGIQRMCLIWVPGGPGPEAPKGGKASSQPPQSHRTGSSDHLVCLGCCKEGARPGDLQTIEAGSQRRRCQRCWVRGLPGVAGLLWRLHRWKEPGLWGLSPGC